MSKTKRNVEILMNRIATFQKECEEHAKQGLFLKFKDDSKIDDMYGLVIGTEDTPYHYGYFLFDINCNVSDGSGGLFPFSPPKIKYLTTNGKIRMTPNYYACGKVCLSFIGTWGDNSWSPSYSIRGILETLQSCLQKYSIYCEPGVSCDKGDKLVIDYDNYVTYHSFDYAFCKMVELCLDEKESKHPIINFREEVLHHAKKNIQNVIDNFHKWIEKEKANINSGIIKGNVRYYSIGEFSYNLKELEARLNNLKNILLQH